MVSAKNQINMAPTAKADRLISMPRKRPKEKNPISFTKKATGKIRFECHDGDLVSNAIEASSKTGDGKVITMKSEGFNSEGISVCTFEFEWSLKVKN